MKRTVVCILLLSLVVLSCKRNKKDTIVGKWHAVKLENPDMDSNFAKNQMYVDTLGKNNDSATNMRLYGVTNMDSVRVVLQATYDSVKELQTAAVLNTVFNFRKDSIVVLSFNGSEDSSKWYFDPSGELVLDELNGKGGGDKVKMQVLSLTDTVLILRFQENKAMSTVTFHPEGK